MTSTKPQKIIAVVGSTGSQGSSVVRTFHYSAEYHIRALTRSTSSEKAKALQAKYPKIELVSADLDDVASLEAAFKDVSVMFANTDFWSLCVPGNATKVAPGQPLNEWAYEQEIQQGKNIFDVAAKVPSLERLVYSSLADCKKWSGGKYSYVLHFQSKAEILEYGEATYPELYKKTSAVQLGFYLENYCSHPFLSPMKAEDGVFEFSDLSPSNKPFPFVAAREDTGPIVAGLVRQPAGKHVVALREQLPLSTFIKQWTKVTGKEARIKPHGALPMFPELAREVGETFKFCDEFGYWGFEDKSVLTPDQLAPELEFGSIEQWIRDQDWTKILS